MDYLTSIWERTASPAPATPPLAESVSADVVVIGAGYTGLSAALRVAEGGAAVVVLDAADPCEGASGRNGGQVIPGVKYDPDTLAELYGEETVRFAGSSADIVFDLVARLGLDCDAERSGWIQPSVKRAHLPALHARAEQWARRGADVAILDADAVRAHTGSGAFVGGWIDRRAGRLHPLKFARQMLAAAQAAGAAVHGRSRAVRTERVGARWRITTDAGFTVVADQVFVGTNGYTDDLVPRLKRTIVPATSFQVATAPLTPEALRRVLPDGAVVSDSRRVANYFRIGPGGRLMIGGRGSFAGARQVGDYDFLVRALWRFFPETRDLPIDFRWFGRLAVTRDFLPHVHRPFPNFTIALGYSGRGVAMATAMGSAIGAHILDETEPLPLKLSSIRPMPVHSLHRQYAALTIRYMRLRDALER